jgi:hypothetical protein
MPGCLQCKKRKTPCPGYEKTLKWSTKYEVFQPTIHFASSPPLKDGGPKTNATKASAKVTTEVALTPNVERHFDEALAAVLPAGQRTPESLQGDISSSRLATPPVTQLDSLTSSYESTPEPNDGSPPELEPLSEPFLFENASVFDSLLLDDDFSDAIGMAHDDFTFANMVGFNVDPGPFECIDFGVEGVQRPGDDATSTATSVTLSSSPRLSRSLLLDFYRLPSPSPSVTSVDDVESVLIQHYFKDVCVLFSSFDSVLNPFRTFISRIFQDTPSTCYAIQSMSAAHLANTFPNMASVGLDLRRKACDALQGELASVQSSQASCTKTFLSIMLLGLSTSWHDASALGEELLTTARSLILPRLLSNSDGEEKQRETQFFEESLIYWEMLMGFVTQDAMTFAPSGLRSRRVPQKVPGTRKSDGKIVPHPWTGIAPTISVLFAEVGRLIRRERMLDPTSGVDIRRRQENLHNAATLEEDLLAAEYPLGDELADFGDERTSKQDFVAMAEAYRCAGLLELYRVFPSILRKRLGTDRSSWLESVDFECPTPRFETPYEDTDTKLWLNSLAMHILDTIDSVPTSSGTVSIQKVLLVAAASELRFVTSVDYFDVYANDAKVLKAREFAIKRLQEYAMRLPAKPIRKMIELITEVWRRQDSGDDAFWIDVMDEKSWQTVLG